MDEFSLDSRFAHQNVDEYVVCCVKHERDRKSKYKVQQTRNLEQEFHENCTNTSNANSIVDTTLEIGYPEDGLEDIGDLNCCIDLDKLNALLEDTDQLSAPTIEENGRDSDCQFAATPTISGGSGFSSINSLTNTNNFLMDTPIDNECLQPIGLWSSGTPSNVLVEGLAFETQSLQGFANY